MSLLKVIGEVEGTDPEPPSAAAANAGRIKSEIETKIKIKLCQFYTKRHVKCTRIYELENASKRSLLISAASAQIFH